MAKKRKYGSGTLRKRSDGRWEARVVTGYDDNGNPKTKSVLAKTKADCLVKLEELKEKYAPPVTKCKPDMPFGDWLDFWYQNYCKPQLRLNTQLGYEDRIYKHIIPEIGSIPLNKLTQNDLQQFYARLKTSGRLIRVEQYGSGLSDRMVRACHASCRSVLQKAVEEGLIRINPAIGCKLPPKKSGEMNILTQEEMQRFLIQAKQDGYYELFLLELGTGLRLGEILALQWDDLNFATGELRITKSVTFIKGELHISEPKTKSSIRTVVLPASLLKVLEEYAFTYPYFGIDLVSPECIVSALIMLAVAIMTGTLTMQIRKTEQMKAEIEKESMRANLLRAISHDLRTPLTAVYGSCSAIIENYDSLEKPDQIKLLCGIQQDAQWLIRMVENLLSVTRIDGEKVLLKMTPTVLEEFIDTVLLKFKKRCPDVPVITDIPDTFVSIPMDAMLMEQVLINILENAVYHAKGMTELRLTVG